MLTLCRMASGYTRQRSSWEVLCASFCKAEASTNHGDKVQQVHPRLVGLGVGQREEGRQLEAHGVARVPALRSTERPVTLLTEIRGDVDG